MSEGLSPDRSTRLLVLGVVTIGTFMAVMDISIVNVALPQIMTSFGVNVKQVKWVSTSFLLTTAVCVPLTGWLGRRIGLGRLFIAELVIFTIGLTLCAVAWSLDVLIAARVIEALGAGAIMTTSLAIITETFPPAERGRAIGIWGIGFMLGPALGPTSGGYLMDWFDWPAIFAINVPVGVVAIGLAFLVLDPGSKEPSLPFDWKGYFALVTFLVGGLLTMDLGQELGWSSQPIVLGIGVTAAAFLLFVALVWDGEHPVFPLRLLHNLDFAACVVLGVLRPIPLYGALFMLPLFLQNVQGRDTIDTGLLLVPAAVTTGVCMPLAGMLTDRFGPRWPTVIGVLAAAYSLYLFTVLDPMVDRWTIIYPQFWRGIGVALLMTAVNTAALNAVPPSETTTASWVLNLTLSVGGAFTIGVLGTLLHRNTQIQIDLLGAAPALAGPPSRELVHQAMRLGFSSTDAGRVAFAALLRKISRSASSLAFQHLYSVLTLLTLAALLPALLLSSGGPPRPAKETERS
ncbi:MAG: DHA2 family efflux MFS transporter permease subunit [bacterium]